MTLLAPGLLWLDSGTAGLKLICGGGITAGLLLLLNAWPRAALIFCWLFYLSFVSAARNFSGFQSDGLMLESALLAIFLAPRGIRPGLGERVPASTVIRLLFWWLCFRLIFESGFAKSTGGDEAWKTFSALQDYYVNCPFPTWLGWYAQQLPDWIHASMTGATLYAEVICPFLLLLGRKGRILLCLLWVGMNFGILLTGNYTYLNYNSIALAVLLLDDRAVRAALPFLPTGKKNASPIIPALWRKIVSALVLIPFLYVGLYIFLAVVRV
ncbi:MAG: lipase maturation factor family protein, partial [Chloroflexi bacterium]|nr:lipase maturation factor family protein [Chloroflexota bacterium]